jgi:hypothetical protein
MTAQGSSGWPTDFTVQLYWAVMEQTRLAEVPLGAVDVAGEHAARHGPGDPEQCSGQLLLWFDVGFLELYREGELPPRATPGQSQEGAVPGRAPALDRAVARELLTSPARWTPDSDDADIRLRPTPLGLAADLGTWAR